MERIRQLPQLKIEHMPRLPLHIGKSCRVELYAIFPYLFQDILPFHSLRDSRQFHSFANQIVLLNHLTSLQDIDRMACAKKIELHAFVCRLSTTCSIQLKRLFCYDFAKTSF